MGDERYQVQACRLLVLFFINNNFKIIITVLFRLLSFQNIIEYGRWASIHTTKIPALSVAWDYRIESQLHLIHKKEKKKGTMVHTSVMGGS